MTRRSGFTLVEVLATITLMGIALPVTMHAITVSIHCAEIARQRNEAAALAEGKLNEIVATAQWQDATSMAGDFSPDWPKYHWTATVSDWTQSGLEQLDVHVTWVDRDGNRDVVASSLVYNGINAGSGASGASGTTGANSTSGTGAGPSGGEK